MLEVSRQDILREEVFIQHDKSYPIGSPSHNILILIVLSREKEYVQKFVGLFQEGRHGPGFLFSLRYLGGCPHVISILANGKIMDRKMAIIELMEVWTGIK
jgi:hypothetical protein